MCDWAPFVAGIAAGVGNVLAGHPLDSLKVRFQTAQLTGIRPLAGGSSAAGSASAASAAGRLSVSPPAAASSAGGALKAAAGAATAAPQLRPRSLLAGLVPPLMTVPWLGGLNFGIYDAARLRLVQTWPSIFARTVAPADAPRGLPGHTGGVLAALVGAPEARSNLLCIFAAGCFSGWTCCHLTLPMHNIKVQQQIQPAGLRRLTIRAAVRRCGLRGLYKAYIPHAVAEGFGRGVYMFGYEMSKQVLDIDPSSRNMSHASFAADLPARILCGSVGGAAAWAVIYPFDVVRNRMMCDWQRKAYTGCIDCVRQTMQQEGIHGFYNGMWFTLLRAVPVAGVTLTTFDFVLGHLR